MYYALHNTAGVIRKVLKGPSLEWAELNRSSEDELIFESETEINNAVEKIENGARVPYTPEKSPEEIQSEIVAAVQSGLDAFAQTRGYDSILSACTYATDPDARFQAEGQHAVAVRGDTWRKLYTLLGEVQAGTRPIPAGFAAIADEFVIPDWPEV